VRKCEINRPTRNHSKLGNEFKTLEKSDKHIGERKHTIHLLMLRIKEEQDQSLQESRNEDTTREGEIKTSKTSQNFSWRSWVEVLWVRESHKGGKGGRAFLYSGGFGDSKIKN